MSERTSRGRRLYLVRAVLFYLETRNVGSRPPRIRSPRLGSVRSAAAVSSRSRGDEGEAMLSGHKDPSRHAIGKGSRSALQVRARRDKVEKKESAKLAAQEAL